MPPQQMAGDRPIRRPSTLRVALTPMQLKVVRGRCHGSLVKTALELGIAEKTARKHMYEAYGRAQVRDFPALLIALGWLEVPRD